MEQKTEHSLTELECYLLMSLQSLVIVVLLVLITINQSVSQSVKTLP